MPRKQKRGTRGKEAFCDIGILPSADEAPTVCPPSTRLEPQSRFGDKLLKFQVVCPQNGTAALRGLRYNAGVNGDQNMWKRPMVEIEMCVERAPSTTTDIYPHEPSVPHHTCFNHRRRRRRPARTPRWLSFCFFVVLPKKM